MTIFEYLAIAFSLAFSFSAARLVEGLPHALAADRRYFVHWLHILNLLITLVAIFWTFWSFRNVEWNLLRFFLALMSPGLLYYLACTLVPESPASIESWRPYYYSVRRSYFLGIGAWALVVALNNTITLHVPFDHPVRAMQLSLLAVSMVGATSESPVLHAGLAIGCSVILIAMLMLTFVPGALAG
jgi:hypothetical protein